MGYRLEHVAINCKDLNESIEYFQKFLGGKPTAIRKGSAGYGFCFMTIDGAPAIQLMESNGETGVHHYGFVVDDIDHVASEFRRKGAEIVRENRDASGKLTTIFVKDCNGLQMELRTAR
ncbi:MAG TPA: VOC family protein [candidate division Zixibacteria bacterium]|nr:VOC family protein [candidate division Zixibacteria bacterium]